MQRIRTWFDFKGTVRTPSNLIGYEESFEFVAGIVRSLQRLNRPIYLAGKIQFFFVSFFFFPSFCFFSDLRRDQGTAKAERWRWMLRCRKAPTSSR
jgi:hypothetical protein